ncbi:MAG: hypothetical protein WA125_06500 [Desulfosporosinus sp.]
MQLSNGHKLHCSVNEPDIKNLQLQVLTSPYQVIDRDVICILRHKLFDWVKKYNLIDVFYEDKRFINIGFGYLYGLITFDENIFGGMELSDAVNYVDEAESSFQANFPFIFRLSTDLLINQLMATTGNSGSSSFPINVNDPESFEGTDNSKKRPHMNYGWDPRRQPWKVFEECVDCLFDKYKIAYEKRTREYLAKQDFYKMPQKRSNEHFRWLVYYQVLGKNCSQIAEILEMESNNDTFMKAINKTASRIQLTLRAPDKGGRPPRNS